MADQGFRAAAKADPAAAERALRQALRYAIVPHAGGQAEVDQDQTRFQLLTAGRRWGKTKLAARKIIRKAMQNPGSLNWWVANYYRNTKRGYQEVVRQIPPALLAKPAPPPTANNLILHFKNGSVIEFYSGGSPDALAGAGVDFMVVDEAALIPENVWFQLLRPTLMDSGGGALIISTPRGRNWFWKLWMLGQGPNKDYRSWRFTSYDNPYIEDTELDEARDTLPDLVFRQEILAEFVEDAATIFRLTNDNVLPAVAEPAGHIYMGVDLAKKEDFTVISADREDGLPCKYDRFNDISWPQQKSIIATTADDLLEQPKVSGVTMIVDSTGIGDVVYDDLADMGYDIIGINFSAGVGGRQKERMVRLLAADLERGRAAIIEDMRDEFEAFEYNITAHGRFTFEAATGHDDKVAAKLLSHWGRVQEGVPGIGLVSTDDHEPEEDEGRTETIRPDAPLELMNNPAVWSSFGG